ncbi:Rid family detoxifying hydrolase [Zunongwangia endophytica]|uniref:Rid family detoxifying hydrolase n=1 Tax=Zunongwangia endophytica TaxID=1808945 RepID=A0ABV8HFG3_9FLAO|nr:Rid family detoxifying hydrolase [Zunongwangia endophytica]MDN3593997.1 Rid family detoxifying hydrolase [Zunongwangia endophytica]
MKKQIIKTEKAPAPIGPYNQAVKTGNMIFISGQIAINPVTGNLETSDLESETKMVMANLQAILDEAGCTFENVIKTSIFISDMNNFSKINEIYGTYFEAKTAPARETVEVANLPKFVNVEISAIAVVE